MIKGQLTDTDRTEIVKYRLEKAYRTYNEAIGSIENGYVETAANRLYYAAYYAVSALLISYKYEASTHNGVIQMFGKVFLRNNRLTLGFSLKSVGSFYVVPSEQIRPSVLTDTNVFFLFIHRQSAKPDFTSSLDQPS